MPLYTGCCCRSRSAHLRNAPIFKNHWRQSCVIFLWFQKHSILLRVEDLWSLDSRLSFGKYNISILIFIFYLFPFELIRWSARATWANRMMSSFHITFRIRMRRLEENGCRWLPVTQCTRWQPMWMNAKKCNSVHERDICACFCGSLLLAQHMHGVRTQSFE